MSFMARALGPSVTRITRASGPGTDYAGLKCNFFARGFWVVREMGGQGIWVWGGLVRPAGNLAWKRVSWKTSLSLTLIRQPMLCWTIGLPQGVAFHHPRSCAWPMPHCTAMRAPRRRLLHWWEGLAYWEGGKQTAVGFSLRGRHQRSHSVLQSAVHGTLPRRNSTPYPLPLAV